MTTEFSETTTFSEPCKIELKSTANCFYPSEVETKISLYSKCQKVRSERIHYSFTDNTKRIVVDTRKCGMAVNSSEVADSKFCYSGFDSSDSKWI